MGYVERSTPRKEPPTRTEKAMKTKESSRLVETGNRKAQTMTAVIAEQNTGRVCARLTVHSAVHVVEATTSPKYAGPRTKVAALGMALGHQLGRFIK